MPRGYRLFSFAAVVAVGLALILALLLQPKEPYFSGDRGYQEQASSYRAGGTDCEPSRIGALPIGLRQRKTDSCAEAEEQHREAADNLIEARRAAVASEAGAFFTYSQARIEAWGAALGFLTLFAAMAAAIFAERAAFHTKDTAEAYRKREKAMLVPALRTTAFAIQAVAKNIGPTNAIIRIANSALFADPPPIPVPFIFEGHGRMSVAIEGEREYDFGEFPIPDAQVFYLIGGIIYETVFGDIELMRAGFVFDIQAESWTPFYDLDWSLWEAQTTKVRHHSK